VHNGVAIFFFGCPARVITVAAPDRNYELKKNDNYILNFRVFGSRI